MNYIDYNSQIYFKQVCKYFNDNLDITNLYLNYRLSQKITNTIIKKYNKLLYLNLYQNKKITDLSNLIYLKKLNISNSLINYDRIKHLTNLEELDISNTNTYFDIKQFNNLKTLYIMGNNNINIQDLLILPKLKKIYIVANYYKNHIIHILDNNKSSITYII